MPRDISPEGFENLTLHDSEGAWISFMSIGLHTREKQSVVDDMAEIASGDGRLYVCNNNVKTKGPQSGTNNVVADDKLYTPFPFEVALANASIEREQTVDLSFDNVDRLLTDVIRRATYPPQIDFAIGLVMKVHFESFGPSNPDGSLKWFANDRNPVAETYGFEMYVNNLELQQVSWNEATIQGTLTKDHILNKAFPSNHAYYEFSNFPGLYGLQQV